MPLPSGGLTSQIPHCDYMKCTQRLDRVYISKRTRCHHLVVAAPPGDVAIGEESSTPTQRLDCLFGFSPQGGKKEPIVQIGEKA